MRFRAESSPRLSDCALPTDPLWLEAARLFDGKTGGVTDTEGVRSREGLLVVVGVSSDAAGDETRSSTEGMGISASARDQPSLGAGVEPVLPPWRYNSCQGILAGNGNLHRD